MTVSKNQLIQYYISIQGEQVGPFSPSDILSKLSQSQISWTDYVFDPTSNEWVALLQHPEFADKYDSVTATNNKKNDSMPATPSLPGSLASVPAEEFAMGLKGMLKEKEWYILKDANNYGPFSKIEVVQMLQAKTLFEYDYIWNQTMASWKRISETPEFQPEEIRKLKFSPHPDIAEIFFRRRHSRAPYGCSLVVHDNQKVYQGQSMEISAGGAGIVLATVKFMPGDQMFLHFQPGEGVPSFNASCTVVSKNTLGRDGQVKYGVKFTHIISEVRESIKNYIHTSKTKAA